MFIIKACTKLVQLCDCSGLLSKQKVVCVLKNI